jgi:hypothetical protein
MNNLDPRKVTIGFAIVGVVLVVILVRVFVFT